MKYISAFWIFPLLLFTATVPASAAIPATEHKFSVTVDRIPARHLVMTFYDHCESVGLLFQPNLAELQERVSVKTPLVTCAEFKKILVGLLQGVSLGIRSGESVDVVARLPKKDMAADWKEFVYSPRFRDPVELGRLLNSFVKEGRFAHLDEDGKESKDLNSLDKLIFFGPSDQIASLKTLLKRFDVAVPQVEISAAIYEFRAGPTEGGASAVIETLKLFSGKLTVSSGQALTGGTLLKINMPNFEGALSFLDKDERFNYIAQPKVLAKNAEQVTFTAGESRRVAGSLAVNGGQSVQSKETLKAGITLRATPYIRDEIVELLLYQNVSSFKAVQGADPAVMDRALTTRLVVEPGQTYVIGGLKINRKASTQHSFFGIPLSDSNDAEDSEIVLLLTVRQENFN